MSKNDFHHLEHPLSTVFFLSFIAIKIGNIIKKKRPADVRNRVKNHNLIGSITFQQPHILTRLPPLQNNLQLRLPQPYQNQMGSNLDFQNQMGSNLDFKTKWGQILTSDIKQSRSFPYCNLTFLSSTINVFNLPTAFDIAE